MGDGEVVGDGDVVGGGAGVRYVEITTLVVPGLQGRVTQKATMKHYKNSKGEGRLFSIEIMVPNPCEDALPIRVCSYLPSIVPGATPTIPLNPKSYSKCTYPSALFQVQSIS